MTLRPLVAIGRSALLLRTLEHLTGVGYQIAGIVTDEANAEYGVGVEDFRSLARRAGAEFCLSKKITAEVIDVVAGWTRGSGASVAISANWRFIVPDQFLSLFPDGVWNLHIGNLPDFKGNATANWSILTGESMTFANVHRMEPALDAAPSSPDCPSRSRPRPTSGRSSPRPRKGHRSSSSSPWHVSPPRPITPRSRTDPTGSGAIPASPRTDSSTGTTAQSPWSASSVRPAAPIPEPSAISALVASSSGVPGRRRSIRRFWLCPAR